MKFKIGDNVSIINIKYNKILHNHFVVEGIKKKGKAYHCMINFDGNEIFIPARRLKLL